MTSTETRRPASGKTDPMVISSGGAHTSPRSKESTRTRGGSSEGNPTSRPANHVSVTRAAALGGDQDSTVGHWGYDAQLDLADGGLSPALDHVHADPQGGGVEGGPGSGTDQRSNGSASPIGPALADPFLALAADIVDDLERDKIANENRLRQLTRSVEDSDGETRGFGLDESHPDVARLAALVDMISKVEHQAVLNLQRKMREHPLGPWVKAQKGLGDKQVARLLAAVGDPYWNDLHDRPRTVSELRSYCGFGDASTQVRRRGQKANWSDDARKRTWLIANSVVKAGGPYREIYDATKAKYADAVHSSPCVRCGPSGHPAPEGSPLSKAHIHARGLRAIAKAVLKDLWTESRRLHELPTDGHRANETHPSLAVGRV